MCGSLSVRTVYHRVKPLLAGADQTGATTSLLGQLYFREMFYLLGAATENFDQQEGNAYCLQVPWSRDPDLEQAWASGQTGYPYIDALMRQLQETGARPGHLCSL